MSVYSCIQTALIEVNKSSIYLLDDGKKKKKETDQGDKSTRNHVRHNHPILKC